MNKPNTRHYTGTDLYSDGSIEDVILHKLMGGCSERQILTEDFCFATHYHFSPMRRNLLSWYDFGSNCNVLEIGAGLGAVTGLLAEKVHRLTCVELSLKRSMINYYRNRHRENIEIIVGNLEDVPLPGDFDYVTLIGVLEYCQMFSANHSYAGWLERLRDLLRTGGKLIIAIENKFGLKYFAGAREDHVGVPFIGLEGYDGQGVRTFAKQEITDLLASVGFKNLEFFFPIPDYKFPNQIFNERCPDYFHLIGNYDEETGYAFEHRAFSEHLVTKQLIQEKQFPFFANSFLIFAERKA